MLNLAFSLRPLSIKQKQMKTLSDCNLLACVPGTQAHECVIKSETLISPTGLQTTVLWPQV